MSHPHCPDVPTLVALLRWRAAHQPERIGYTFLADGERDERNLTYAELDRRARAVAVWLAANGGGRGERALVLVEESLDYLVALFGCMYAGVLAVPVHPPDPARLARTLPRLLTIAENAGVVAVLTSHEVFVASRAGLSEIPVLARAAWLAVDTDEASAPDTWVDPALGPDDLAYLQYTSGSTATPKGVMVSHRNLLHQLTDFDTGYAHDPEAVLVSWLPATHDLGLVYARFMPLFIGMRCVFFSPVAFMARPARWLEAVTRYRATHTPSPNFGFELAARKVTAAEKARLDLLSLRVVLNGAEPIRQESERLFQEAFAPRGLSPTAVTHAMGMSEATAKIVTEPIDRSPPRFLTIDGPAYERNEVVVVPEGTPRARQVASNGTTLLDTRVVIVDPERKVKQADGRVGEMWVGGTTVAQGYWNNPAATEETFRAHTLDGDGPFLRTGDLAFVHDGEVYLTGRLKDVLIIRGQNHHPQDLEWTLAAAHPAIRPNCAAVFAVVDDGRDQLVVVTEVATAPLAEPAPVFAAIRRAISEEHGLVPSTIVLIAPRALPKTSSGKIQRGRARELFVAGELDLVARWDAAAAAEPGPDDLADKLAGLSGRRRESALLDHLVATAAALTGLTFEEVETDRPVREIGLDSVSAVELVERTARALGRHVPVTALFDYPTLESLARHLCAGPPILSLSSPAPPSASRVAVEAMSEEEATAALLAELADLE